MMLTVSQAVKNGLLRDGVTPYSNVDPILAAEKVMQGSFIFPYVGELDVSKNNEINWQPVFEDNRASKELWFYSFVFLDYLIKAYVITSHDSFWEKAVEFYYSYQNWKTATAESNVKLFNDEHAVTNRSLVFSQFLHVATKKSDARLYEQLGNDLKNHADWLMLDENYVYNNHGVMMDRALLNAYTQLRELSNSMIINVSPSKLWLEKALFRLNMMIEKTFDSKGCCTENSPSYHMLNLSLFGAIDSFLRKNNIENASFNSKLKLALDAANFMIHEDGTLPLIGDSENKASVYVPDSLHKGKYGVGFFPESGFSIVKEKDFFLTFKCGGSSFSHRHIDDTSITLRVGGLDFICDGGMYNYDNSNELRKYFVSYRAHSGFFSEQASAIRFKDFKSAREMAKTTNLISDKSFISIEGENYYSENCKFKRRINIEKIDNEKVSSILIFDSFKSSENDNWKVQFLLHPDVSIKKSDTGFVLKRNSISLFLGFCSNSKFAVNIEPAHFSESYLVCKKTSIIVVSGRTCSLGITSLISVL
ncbi:heparinase II/III family protein [Rheinheimera sp. UJ51]|uniref:heparinase II/III domain-containing protein n=1 Tax=Rheinheimera sp. UJ51 TaxID=2892446 RepID=UPI001E446795|nr:heparinase II/III family protein [Rheinheimera sp. UJ51]MCC5450274.1 heparinase II/III family protein [Rheinheimera sp. UJ51]